MEIEYLSGKANGYDDYTTVVHATYEGKSMDYPLRCYPQELKYFQEELAKHINSNGVVPINSKFQPDLETSMNILEDSTLKNNLAKQQISQLFEKVRYVSQTNMILQKNPTALNPTVLNLSSPIKYKLSPNVVDLDALGIKPIKITDKEIVFSDKDTAKINARLAFQEQTQGQNTASVPQSTQELETELQQRHEMLAQKGDLSGGQNHAINYQARLNAIEADLRNGNTSDLANQIGLAKQNIAADTRFESGQLKPTAVGSAVLSPNRQGIRS